MTRTGLLFVRPRSVVDHLIDVFTHRMNGAPNVSHVAVITHIGGRFYYGYESWFPVGVREAKWPKSDRVVFRAIPLTPRERQDLVAHCKDHLGDPYGIAAIVWHILTAPLELMGIHLRRSPVEHWRGHRQTCSRFATEAYRAVGVDLAEGADAATETPQTLLNRIWG